MASDGAQKLTVRQFLATTSTPSGTRIDRMDLGNIIQMAVATAVTVIGYLMKRSIDESERRSEQSREENGKKLDIIQADLKVLVAALSDQRGDIRVAEERQRKLDAEFRVIEERSRKLDEEMLLSRQRYHDLAGKVQVVLARLEPRRPATQPPLVTEESTG